MSFILHKVPPSFFFDTLLDDPLTRGSSTFANPSTTVLDQFMGNPFLSNTQQQGGGAGSCWSIISNDKEFRWYLDLPGVKASDMEVEVLDDGRKLSISGVRRIFTGKENVSTNAVKKYRFAHILPLNPKEADTSKIEANLSDGVLVVTAPKVPEAQPVSVPVTSEPHQEEKVDVDEAHVFSIDLPGVKAEDLNVEVKDEMISIYGSRRVIGKGGKKETFSHTIRAFQHNCQDVETTKIKANVADGVLVIIAPKKKNMISQEKQKSKVVSISTKPHTEEKEQDRTGGEPVAITTNQNKKKQEDKTDESPTVGKQ